MKTDHLSNLNLLLTALVVIGIGSFMIGLAYFAFTPASHYEGVAFCGTPDDLPFNIEESSQPIFQLGKNLFRENCKQCHNSNMKDDMTGPALGGVTERWNAYDRADLFAWIRNSQKLIAEKHPKALALKNQYITVMQSFPNLSDDEINAILYYIESK